MAETYYSLTDIVKLCDNLVAAMPTSFYSGIMTVRTGLANIPAADVVPVVRCGECKWSDNYGLDLMCQKHSGITKNKLGEDIHFVEWHSKNFFCADGERMKNDG